jgi:hypothetical protein
MGGNGTFGPGVFSSAIPRNPSPVADLTGVWDVRRVSGALPPMYGVYKRITGSRGSTHASVLPALPFEVVGLTLRYRFPPGLVDHLEPAGENVYDGRATLFGRELGRFRMTRRGG